MTVVFIAPPGPQVWPIVVICIITACFVAYETWSTLRKYIGKKGKL
jgi:hypothetical protein